MSFFRNSRLVIDWHNYGYSILALKLGEQHPLVSISKGYESWLAGTAHINLTVSRAMERQLKRQFRQATSTFTLYDRPRRAFLENLAGDDYQILHRLPETMPFADRVVNGSMRLVVSCTSWTADEDFSILLDALVGYSNLATSSHPQLPELLVVITGKGPQKDDYLKQITKLKSSDALEMVNIKTAWLDELDYPKLLRAANLGVCLHKSSSGVDLPMKVIDMFSAGLPVFAWSMYESFPELVKEGVNGRGFGSAEDLQTLFVQLLGPDLSKLQALKRGAEREIFEKDWDTEWDSSLGKIIGCITEDKPAS